MKRSITTNAARLTTLLVTLTLSALLGACAGDRVRRDPDPAREGPALELLVAGDTHFRQKQYTEAKRMYARAVSANGPDHVYVEACAQVARMESLTGNLNEGLPWLQLGAKRAREDEPLGWSRLQMVTGIFERERGERPAALARFKELYTYCIKYKLYERAIDVAHHVVLAADDIEEQMTWSEKGIEAAEAGGLFNWLAVLWNNKAVALEEQGRFEDALLAFQSARDYHRKTGDEGRILIADWAVARALRLTGRFDEARELTWTTHERALERYEKEPGPESAEWVGYTRWELAELLATDGDLDGALAGLKQARTSLIEAKIETWGTFGLSELKRLDARIAMLQAALELEG